MIKIGYLKIHKDGERYAGGVMIVDSRGIPVEFKYTDPITPTKLQKVLYGDVLEKYLREEIIIGNIVGKIENKADIFISDSIENEILTDYVKEIVVIIKKTQIKPLKENEYKFIKENEAVVQINEGESPVRVIITKNNIEKKEEIIEKILEIGKGIDLVEPLTRIEEAIELICKGEL